MSLQVRRGTKCLAVYPVSLAHLRGLDPHTRIVIRTELCDEADEGAHV
jgi:hypothetical protein